MRINQPPYVINLHRPEPAAKENNAGQAAQASQAAQAGAVQSSEAARPSQAGQPVPAAGRVRTLDRVEISPRIREMERLKRELDAMPDVRLDRVALAKQNLQQGGKVDASFLAQKMMESLGRKIGG